MFICLFTHQLSPFLHVPFTLSAVPPCCENDSVLFFCFYFIYSFGFMIPTILMFSFTTTLDKTFIQTFAIRSLTYDFIFTMLLSFTLIDRKIYKLRPIREFLVQIMLCLISIVLLEIIILTPNTPPDM